jgi:hypothetical protein
MSIATIKVSYILLFILTFMSCSISMATLEGLYLTQEEYTTFSEKTNIEFRIVFWYENKYLTLCS